MEQGEEGARENNLKSAREGGGDGEQVEKSKAARKGTGGTKSATGRRVID